MTHKTFISKLYYFLCLAVEDAAKKALLLLYLLVLEKCLFGCTNLNREINLEYFVFLYFDLFRRVILGVSIFLGLRTIF